MDSKGIIKPVDIDESQYNKIQHQVGAVQFTHPCLIANVGHVKAGKSTLMYNHITDFFKPIFEDRIILFSPSYNDPIIKKLIDEELVYAHYPDYSNDLLKGVLEIIKENHKDNPNDRWLICFDDLLASMFRHNMSKDGRWLNAYIARYRHFPVEGAISLMFFSQYWRDYSSIMRSNTTFVNFLGSHSEKHRKVYAEELSAVFGGDEKKFMEIWNKAKRGKFDFLSLDFNELKAYRNYEEVIYDRDSEFSLDTDEPENKKVLEESEESEEEK
jgi:hypothetical protein